MARTRVCVASELGPGEKQAFFVDGWEVLVLRDEDGALHAVDGICPHEDFPLIYGDFDGTVLVCANHAWMFDVTTGRGINPPTCKLTKYFVAAEGDDVFVDTDADRGS